MNFVAPITIVRSRNFHHHHHHHHHQASLPSYCSCKNSCQPVSVWQFFSTKKRCGSQVGRLQFTAPPLQKAWTVSANCGQNRYASPWTLGVHFRVGMISFKSFKISNLIIQRSWRSWLNIFNKNKLGLSAWFELKVMGSQPTPPNVLPPEIGPY